MDSLRCQRTCNCIVIFATAILANASACNDCPLDWRGLKGLELAAKARIRFADGAWLVPSPTSPGTTCRVSIGPEPSCPCDDWLLRRSDCKHLLAAKIVAARIGKGPCPEIVADAVPRKPTYKQNRPLHDQAQRTEKNRFQTVLHALCHGLEDPPQPKTGRRWKPMADVVFACAFKVFRTLSSRRFQCDLDDALEGGYLSESMRSVRVCAYLDSEFLTPVLQGPIVRSSLPLKAVETTFAPGSTGFSTSRFVRWSDEK